MARSKNEKITLSKLTSEIGYSAAVNVFLINKKLGRSFWKNLNQKDLFRILREAPYDSKIRKKCSKELKKSLVKIKQPI